MVVETYFSAKIMQDIVGYNNISPIIQAIKVYRWMITYNGKETPGLAESKRFVEGVMHHVDQMQMGIHEYIHKYNNPKARDNVFEKIEAIALRDACKEEGLNAYFDPIRWEIIKRAY